MQSLKRAFGTTAVAGKNKVSIDWNGVREENVSLWQSTLLRAVELNPKLKDKDLKIVVGYVRGEDKTDVLLTHFLSGEPHLNPVDKAKGKDKADETWHLSGSIYNLDEQHLTGVHVRLVAPEEHVFSNKKFKLGPATNDKKD